MAGIRSFGAEFTFDSDAVPGLRDISISESDAAEIDVTTHDETSDWRVFIGGLKDGGSITLSGMYSAGNPLAATDDDGTAKSCVLTFSDGGTATFNGVLKGFGVSLGIDDAVQFNATIKISGAVTYAAAS